jgi:hypothetical protein
MTATQTPDRDALIEAVALAFAGIHAVDAQGRVVDHRDLARAAIEALEMFHAGFAAGLLDAAKLEPAP